MVIGRWRLGVSSSNRDLDKEKHWQGIVDRHGQSGKSIAQFCKDEGLIDSRFYYWQSTLTKRKKNKSRPKPPENKVAIPFVPLSLPNNIDFSNRQNAAEQIEISKIVLRISANTDNTTLACILQSLEKA
jgi:hypothetical protein